VKDRQKLRKLRPGGGWPEARGGKRTIYLIRRYRATQHFRRQRQLPDANKVIYQNCRVFQFLGSLFSFHRQSDRTYLFSTNVAVDEFVELTEQFNFKHGIELLNYHVKLTECATRVHECLSRKFDSWVRNAYGEQDIHFVGSACKYRPIL